MEATTDEHPLRLPIKSKSLGRAATMKRLSRSQSKMVFHTASETWQQQISTKDTTPGSPHPDDEWGFDARSGRMFRVLLVALAVGASLTSFMVDRGSEFLGFLCGQVVEVLGGIASPSLVQACFCVLMACLARVMVEIAPQASGSGLPEVKCILSGLPMAGFLTPRVMAAKFVGLTLALGGGLPVGKEGPFVHIASCVGHWIRHHSGLPLDALPKEDVLLAAVAVGVGATFSAPVGGVLFALELMMPLMLDRKDYSACFFASTCGTLSFLGLNMLFVNGAIQPMFQSDVRPEKSTSLMAEIAFIALCGAVGAFCGAMGSVFVHCHRGTVKVVNLLRGMSKPPKLLKNAADAMRSAGKNIVQPLIPAAEKVAAEPPAARGPSMWRDFIIVGIVAAASSALKTQSGQALFGLGGAPLLTTFLSVDGNGLLDSWPLILLFLTVKWIQTMIALALPIPAGCVAPTLVLGAIMGRLIGMCVPEPLRQFLDPGGDFKEFETRLAIIGATAFCGSVCRVISVVVTVFELIAVRKLILPLALSTVLGNYCANKIGPSFFDSILIMKRVPALPTLQAINRACEEVGRVMRPQLMQLCLPRYVKEEDIQRVQRLCDSMGQDGQEVPLVIPIVEEVSRSEKILCGTVDLQYLEDLRMDILNKQARLQRELPGDGWTKSPMDLLQVVASRGLLMAPLQVDSNVTLKEAYLRAKALHTTGPIFVVNCGLLVGILPQGDLLKVSV